MNKTIKLIFYILIIFILMNIVFTTDVFATDVNSSVKRVDKVSELSGEDVPSPIATATKVVIVFGQILLAGFFTIKLALAGIAYFSAVAAEQKTAAKTKMTNTLIYGVLAYLAVFLFSHVMGLL